jgi:hypothetical protein
MINRITGDRSVDWLRWLHERGLIESEQALHDALARIVDMKMAEIRELKAERDNDRG